MLYITCLYFSFDKTCQHVTWSFCLLNIFFKCVWLHNTFAESNFHPLTFFSSSFPQKTKKTEQTLFLSSLLSVKTSLLRTSTSTSHKERQREDGGKILPERGVAGNGAGNNGMCKRWFKHSVQSSNFERHELSCLHRLLLWSRCSSSPSFSVLLFQVSSWSIWN